jgi:hypothetical protein
VLRAPFIGPEEEGSGQAVGGGECSFKAMVFKDGMGEEEVMLLRLDGGLEGYDRALRFDYFRVREGDQRR